jgi:lysine 2,3-aminomutase
MKKIQELDKIAITVKSHKLLQQLLQENPELEQIMRNAKNETEALIGVQQWVMGILQTSSKTAIKYYNREYQGHDALKKLKWKEIAAIRILDYIDNAGRVFKDQNLRGEDAVSNPIKLIWLSGKPWYWRR